MTLGVLVNQELAISTTEYVSDTKTVSVTQIAYLRQGATLSLVLYPGSHVIEKGSTWNILLLGMGVFTLCMAIFLTVRKTETYFVRESSIQTF